MWERVCANMHMYMCIKLYVWIDNLPPQISEIVYRTEQCAHAADAGVLSWLLLRQFLRDWLNTLIRPSLGCKELYFVYLLSGWCLISNVSKIIQKSNNFGSHAQTQHLICIHCYRTSESFCLFFFFISPCIQPMEMH